MARFDLEKLAEELAAKVRPDFEREIEKARVEGYRAGIDAAAKWVEGQATAPHFTAQLRFTIADGIRRAVAPPVGRCPDCECVHDYLGPDVDCAPRRKS